MPANGESFERMELTFRAEPASVNRSALPGGWLVWCLLGCALGIGLWLLGRDYLLRSLRHRLTAADSVGEVLIVAEGLA